MKIISSYAYKGRNIYSHKPVVKMVVDLQDLFDTPTKCIEGLNEYLLNTLPGLKKHSCSRGYEGGFVERLQEGTYLAHVIEHISIELQNILGYDIAFGKAYRVENDRIYDVIYGYTNELAGLECGRIAVDMINFFVEGKIFDFDKEMKELKSRCIRTDLGVSTSMIKREAEKRGIPVIRIGDGSLLQLGYGKNSRRIQATLSDNSTCIAVDIACNKNLAKTLMSEYGIPVPEGKVVRNEKELLQYCMTIGFPVVIKPNYGSHGIGVSINLKTPEEVLNAYKIASEYEDTILVEKFIKGKHYRLLVVGDKMVAASLRLAAHVIGDGIRTIEELIEKENSENPLRGEDHEKPLTKIVVDKIVEAYLKKQNKTLQYVPKKDEIVYLRENDNLSTGGIAIDVTENVHPVNANLAVMAAKVIGLDIAGVDITVSDISIPLDRANGAVIEINAAPGIRMHHFPSQGKGRNVAGEIIRLLCPDARKASIPIISVTGTNGKTTTVRMIVHILRNMGYNVGMTNTDGVYFNEECMRKGDNTGPVSARAVLMDKRVDYAVLETARGGIVNKGLGYDLADVGLITNIQEDHLGIDGIENMEDLAFVKSLVIEAVKKDGYAVLNADDEYCMMIKDRVKSNLILYSTNPNNEYLINHINKGGIGFYVDEENLYICKGKEASAIMAIEQIPATMGGILKHNIYNALAAAAGAYGLGIEIENIVYGLSTFECSQKHNPGRFNQFDVNGVKVIIDYAHNIDGYKNILNSLKAMKKKRLIGVIGVPGDRTDSSTISIGEICGNCFDRVYIKEDKDKRNRKPGEIAELLKRGCRLGRIPESEITIELSETKAFEIAIANAEPGDIVIVFYEEYEPLLQVIEKMKASFDKAGLIIA
ncbi:MAG: cyanophycin synthetase [Clostridiales bacterium]|nr:cyanophycin synthetase [Clostridiales bacterium]